MKKILFLMASAALSMGAAAQNVMSVELNSGNALNVSLDSLKRVIFTDGTPTDFSAKDTVYVYVHDTVTVTKTVELRTLTFDDADYKGTGNVAGERNWSSLIDTVQYGGQWLYGSKTSDYMWYDEGNTELVWDGFRDTGMGKAFWSGGYAISNYYDTVLTNGTYTTQLAIPLEQSDNQFCVFFQHVDNTSYCQGLNVYPIYFADKVARVVRSIDITNTTYTANSLTNGDSFASAADENALFEVVVRGYPSIDDENTYVEVSAPLCKGTDVLKEWKTMDCTGLGAVQGFRIYVRDTNNTLSGTYGLNTPGYGAIDNIVVEFAK